MLKRRLCWTITIDYAQLYHSTHVSTHNGRQVRKQNHQKPGSNHQQPSLNRVGLSLKVFETVLKTTFD